MTRWNRPLLAVVLGAAIACVAVGCSTPPSGPATPAVAQQDWLAKSIQATQMVDQAVLAADAAVRAGTLKGEAAQKTLAGLKVARDGLRVTVTASQPVGVKP